VSVIVHVCPTGAVQLMLVAESSETNVAAGSENELQLLGKHVLIYVALST